MTRQCVKWFSLSELLKETGGLLLCVLSSSGETSEFVFSNTQQCPSRPPHTLCQAAPVNLVLSSATPGSVVSLPPTLPSPGFTKEKGAQVRELIARQPGVCYLGNIRALGLWMDISDGCLSATPDALDDSRALALFLAPTSLVKWGK